MILSCNFDKNINYNQYVLNKFFIVPFMWICIDLLSFGYLRRKYTFSCKFIWDCVFISLTCYRDMQ